MYNCSPVPCAPLESFWVTSLLTGMVRDKQMQCAHVLKHCHVIELQWQHPYILCQLFSLLKCQLILQTWAQSGIYRIE
jgi:hypothetical protein